MNVVRMVIAVFLLPVVFAFIWKFVDIVILLFGSESLSVVPFWIGVVSYALFQIIMAKPLRTYVFGHELTHAIAGILNGARIKKFKVTATGGSVSLTKTGLFISLAPYFIPIYTLVVILLYSGLSYFWDISAFYGVWVFFIGFTLAFHVSLTYYAISQGQSDLKKFGIFFSILCIFIMNCVVMVTIFKVVFPEMISLRGYFLDSIKFTYVVGKTIFEEGKHLWISFQPMK